MKLEKFAQILLAIGILLTGIGAYVAWYNDKVLDIHREYLGQLTILIGFILTAIGGFGIWYFGQKDNKPASKDDVENIIDLAISKIQ
jgi:hypothetical protein